MEEFIYYSNRPETVENLNYLKDIEKIKKYNEDLLFNISPISSIYLVFLCQLVQLNKWTK